MAYSTKRSRLVKGYLLQGERAPFAGQNTAKRMAKCGKYGGEKLWKTAGKAMKRGKSGHKLLYGRL
ncbi:hypothetical protein [uncultured Prevotella sp.]|uniref:hypothetical protein n=1 Tax=uncultured Prevotella sp. TaxID=159272 RepID=UPI00262EDBDC|nr:hypothetical protein [uncultured Prevotella sp.]